jgi:hypothetical protein
MDCVARGATREDCMKAPANATRHATSAQFTALQPPAPPACWPAQALTSPRRVPAVLLGEGTPVGTIECVLAQGSLRRSALTTRLR